MQRLVQILSLIMPLAAWVLVPSCKPVGDTGSRILETGGTTVDWRMKSTLASTGDLTLEKTGNGATADAAAITDVQYEVSSAPDSTLAAASLTAKSWMPLTTSVDTGEVKFNVLVNTKALGLCYSNDVALNGSNDPVTCKDAPTATSTATTDPEKTQKIGEMRAACKKLSTTPIDAAKPSEFYASFDERLNAEKCTCKNGKARDLFYESYMVTKSTATAKFEEDCKKLVDLLDSSTGTSTATTYAEFAKLNQGTLTETGTKATGTPTGTETGTGTVTDTSTDKTPPLPTKKDGDL